MYLYGSYNKNPEIHLEPTKPEEGAQVWTWSEPKTSTARSSSNYERLTLHSLTYNYFWSDSQRFNTTYILQALLMCSETIASCASIGSLYIS